MCSIRWVMSTFFAGSIFQYAEETSQSALLPTAALRRAFRTKTHAYVGAFCLNSPPLLYVLSSPSGRRFTSTGAAYSGWWPNTHVSQTQLEA